MSEIEKAKFMETWKAVRAKYGRMEEAHPPDSEQEKLAKAFLKVCKAYRSAESSCDAHEFITVVGDIVNEYEPRAESPADAVVNGPPKGN